MTVTTEAAERLMKRCQIGVRYSQKNWEEAHDIMAACYGTIGARAGVSKCSRTAE